MEAVVTTKTNQSHPAAASSLLKATGRSDRFDAVLDLGKRLVAELELSDSNDTLGLWMAHYVAGLIDDAATATQEDRPAKEARIRDAILELWAHRAEMPDGTRPFQELEPILRSLESLDPESSSYRYPILIISPAQQPKKSSKKQGRTSKTTEPIQWVETARSLDRSARVLIKYCLTRAAEAGLKKPAEWARLAEEAGMGADPEALVIRFVSDRPDDSNSRLHEAKRRILTDRKEKLEEILKLSSVLVQELEKRLSQLPPTPKRKTDASTRRTAVKPRRRKRT
jgi:hypothetical protein